jgi:thiamine monophosphate kinase
MKRKGKWLTAVALMAVLTVASNAAAIAANPPLQCSLRLALTLTPDVPNAQAPGFLDAILSDPQYQLTWLGGSDTQATLELTGPGPRSQCEAAVNRLSRDSHVLDVRVLPQQRVAEANTGTPEG